MTRAGAAPVLLVVDDEERILSALRRSLRREGWRIVAVTDPREALRVLETEPVDAIVSDHKMPGLCGLDLLEAAARRRPDAARILITGWPESVSPDRAAALGLRALLSKPWDDAELRAALRAVLAPR